MSQPGKSMNRRRNWTERREYNCRTAATWRGSQYRTNWKGRSIVFTVGRKSRM